MDSPSFISTSDISSQSDGFKKKFSEILKVCPPSIPDTILEMSTLPPSEVPSQSQMSDDSIVSDYKALIERKTIPGLKSVADLMTDSPEIVVCVFGIVKSVRDSSDNKFKYITLIDPTSDNGIELLTRGLKIPVGKMMKVSNILKIVKTDSTTIFKFSDATRFSFFPLFSYNYDDPTSDERNKALSKSIFYIEQDKEICHILEKWYSFRILNGSKLSQLPKPGEFVDICCQVVYCIKTPLCINALIRDGTVPNYEPLFGIDGRLPDRPVNPERVNDDYEKYFALIIWKAKVGYDNSRHYDTFNCINLASKDDLVALFNLQVVEDPNRSGKVSLVMRSSKKWGKAVRLVHRNSILGRMFLHQYEQFNSQSIPKSPSSSFIRIDDDLLSNQVFQKSENLRLLSPSINSHQKLTKEANCNRMKPVLVNAKRKREIEYDLIEAINQSNQNYYESIFSETDKLDNQWSDVQQLKRLKTQAERLIKHMGLVIEHFENQKTIGNPQKL